MRRVCFEKCVNKIEPFSIEKYSSTEKEPTHYLKYSSLFMTPPLAYLYGIQFYPPLDLGNPYYYSPYCVLKLKLFDIMSVFLSYKEFSRKCW